MFKACPQVDLQVRKNCPFGQLFNSLPLCRYIADLNYDVTHRVDLIDDRRTEVRDIQFHLLRKEVIHPQLPLRMPCS